MTEDPQHLSLRGIGVHIVQMYLGDLGGREVAPDLVAGAGWEAQVQAGQPVQIGAVRLGVTEVKFSGEPASVEAVLAAFKLLVLRAGG